MVGGLDVSVVDNHVEDVRGGRTLQPAPPTPPRPERPASFDVLQSLALQIGEERLERSDLHLAAVRLRSSVLDYIEGDDTLWEHEPLEQLADEGQLMAYRHPGFWQCMDTLRDKHLLNTLWNRGNPPWKLWG